MANERIANVIHSKIRFKSLKSDTSALALSSDDGESKTRSVRERSERGRATANAGCGLEKERAMQQGKLDECARLIDPETGKAALAMLA